MKENNHTTQQNTFELLAPAGSLAIFKAVVEHSGDTVEIVEKCGDWYKVNFNGKTGYAHGKYLNVTDSGKDISMFSEDALKLFLDLMQRGMVSEDEAESSTALTPEGNMTLVDDIGEEEDKSSQQFIDAGDKEGEHLRSETSTVIRTATRMCIS